MNEEILKLFKKYKQSGVLVDTNLLLLFIVGSVDPKLISRTPRTSSFTFDDFQIVDRAVEFFDVRISTPHILTEVSNLIGRDLNIRRALGSYVRTSLEKFAQGLELVSEESFPTFGIADTATYTISKNKYLVMTDDGPLFGFLTNKGVDAVNLTTLRRLIP